MNRPPPDPTHDPDRPKHLMSIKDTIAYLHQLTGKEPSPSTVYRWVQRGLDGAKLRTVAVGDEMHTCEDWIWEFLNRRNPAGTDTKPGRTRRLTPAQRRRQQQRIGAELEAAGW